MKLSDQMVNTAISTSSTPMGSQRDVALRIGFEQYLGAANWRTFG
ncbi:hypothetical protein [Bradyrhizobium sp. CCGB12]|nr:hypothetical protein [Bradyrhizobium sp. CCGB12]